MSFVSKPSKFDVVCNDNDIEHRLTKPGTPKTNGMVAQGLTKLLKIRQLR
ncbi:MAG: hypothetical protein IIC76_09545 [Bacteroidetes bacterium]|nr:hypothetical protein [Bacteroidota bacterium]